MHAQTARHLLFQSSDTSLGRYAVIDAAATSRDDCIYNRLSHPDIRKQILFTGEHAVSADHIAPYLIQLDDQADLVNWLMEIGWGNGWGIFLTSREKPEIVLAHARRFFQVRAENGRDIFFRYYDPVILRDFLPLLDTRESLSFFGPVASFIVEDENGHPLVFDKPEGRLEIDSDPARIIFGTDRGEFFFTAWNDSLIRRHVDAYAQLGLEAAPGSGGLSLTLRDKAGTQARIRKTARGVATTTGEGRVFDYGLSLCKHPLQVTDPAGNTIFFDIQDRQNQPDSTPDSAHVDHAPDDNLLYAIRMNDSARSWVFEYDDNNHLKRIDYADDTHALASHDAFGHLVRFTDRCGNTSCLDRDFYERLTCFTDANGQETQFGYDDFAAPSSIAFADGKTFNFDYTDAGNLEAFLAGDVRVATYQVDPESGSWSVTYADGTSSEFEVENGKITRASNAAGSVELAYDDCGRLISETFQGRTVAYHRNETGHLIGMTTPLGRTLDYERDAEDRVCGIMDWDGRKIEVQYALNGALDSICYPNGGRLAQRTASDGLPSELKLTTPLTDEPVFQKRLMRDPLNRITRIIDGDNTIEYTYDKEGRLRNTNSNLPGLTETFAIDAKANRLSDHSAQYAVNEADRLIKAGAIAFEYDGLGNTTRGTCPNGTAQYNYSSLNRLDAIALGHGRVKYLYDAFGRRVAKKVNGMTTRFYWAGDQIVHEVQLDNTGSRPSIDVIDYLFFPETPVLLALRRDGQTHWAAFGHRYEVLCLMDASGKVAWLADYNAFGSARILAGDDLYQPFRLPGQYFDRESGLHYNLSRYYDPELGRYLSLDPLFFEGGSDNFYVYCNGDPINHIDPRGEFIFVPILIGAVLGAAIAGGIEAWRQHRTGEGMDGFKIAKAALLGAVIGAVGGGAGAAVEAAMAVGTAGTAMASSTLAGMGTAGFLSGTAGSIAEQCAQAAATGTGIDPMAITRQALTDGVIGAALGMVTMGAGGFMAKRLRKAADAFGPNLPAERSVSLTAKANQKSRTVSAGAKSTGAKKNARSNDFCVKDPVNPVTGEVVLAQTDFTLAGRMPLTWTREYSSASSYDGVLGRGWQTPADARLEIDDDGLVTFCDGTPKAAVFETLPENEPIMEVADGAMLEVDDEHYRVRLKSGVVYHFNRTFSDDLSRVTQISTPDNHWLRFVRKEGALLRIHNDSGQSIQVLNERGRIAQMVFQDKPLVSYRYTDGVLTGAKDPLGHWKRFYYDQGRLVRHMDKNKLSFYYRYNKEGQCIHTHGDNALYACDLEYRPYERCTRMIDLPSGYVTTFYYDNDNLPVKVQDPTGANTRYVYDDVGRLTKITDPLGRSTEYEYDAAGNIIAILRPDNSRIAIAYDERHKPLQLLDANGKIWERRYDDKGRLIEKISPLDERTRYTYNRQGDLAAVIDPEANTATFEYDETGIICAIADADHNTTRYQRDRLGNITAVIDPAGRSTRYRYDDKSRLLQIVHPSGTTQQFEWDPEDNLLQHTDPNGQETRFEYGGVNEIVRRINADGTGVRYAYDNEERLIAITNEKGQHHRFIYDPAGRVSSQTDYYGRTTSYRYDTAGQLIQSIDPMNRSVAYAYDPLGRLQTKTFENDEQEFFNRDANGNLTGFQSPEAVVERFYDAANNLIAEKNGSFAVEYQYDKNGRRIRRDTTHGNRVRYGYDPRGAVTSIQINDQAPITIERDKLGRIDTEHLSPSLKRTFTYTDTDLIARQSIRGATERIDRYYDYDPAGNLIARQDNAKGPWRFSHDPMNRIIQASNPEQQLQHLSYDPAGDLLEHLPDMASGLRRAGYNGIQYSYDPAGNLVERRSDDDMIRLTWDEQNRLKTVRTGDDTRIDMAYDALGRRCSKAVNGERTFFRWDGDTLLSEQFEDQGAREYVYYPGTFEPLAVIDGDGSIHYYHNDPNGLPQELTTSAGEVVWSACYDALGRVYEIPIEDVHQPLRMQGQYCDPEIDLCYNRYRYFDPRICAFISQDPLGLAAGENIYAYAPNVWGWVDPLGLACENASKKTFRGGSATDNNLTPRPQDVDGLSTFDNLETATKPGGKAQVIDTSKLIELEAVPDAPPAGHVSIRPKDKTRMQEWIDSRDATETHPFTQEVKNAIIETVKRPKN